MLKKMSLKSEAWTDALMPAFKNHREQLVLLWLGYLVQLGHRDDLWQILQTKKSLLLGLEGSLWSLVK